MHDAPRLLQDPDVKCDDDKFGPSLPNESGDMSRIQMEVAENHLGVMMRRSRIRSNWSSPRWSRTRSLRGQVARSTVGGDWSLLAKISRDMWAFLIATAIPPTLFHVRSSTIRDVFAGTGGGFDERDTIVGTRPPEPLGCSFCVRRSSDDALRQLLLECFHERQGRERVASTRQTP